VNTYHKIGCGGAKCLKCEVAFEKSSANQSYCSSTCRIDAHRYIKGNPEIRCCKICEQPFKCVVANQKYCSDECRNKTKIYSDRRFANRRCLNCSFAFSSKSENHFFCSLRCRKAYPAWGSSSQMAQGHPPVNKPCAVCGKTFLGVENHSFCSKECSRKNVLQTSRFLLFERDSFSCVACGVSPLLKAGVMLSVEKIRKDAESVAGNMVTLCLKCGTPNEEEQLKKMECEVASRNKTWEISAQLYVKVKNQVTIDDRMLPRIAENGSVVAANSAS